MTSINGKVNGSFLETDIASALGNDYEKINNTYQSKAWLCGRTTTEENFTDYKKVNLDKYKNFRIQESDYIAVNNAEMYYISIDAKGKVGWSSNTLKYENRPDAHIIEVLTEETTNEYKAFLRDLNISYITAGDKKLNCRLAVEKLKELFKIDKIMLSGGGYINGSFLEEGLIDELSLVVVPISETGSTSVSTFEKYDSLSHINYQYFVLKEIKHLDNNGIWLRYILG